MNYHGQESVKSIANFGEGTLPDDLVRAYALVKKSALAALQESESRFSPEVYTCIIKAVDETAAGKHNDQFTLSLHQGGAGTSINMMINEVIAARSNELIIESGAGKSIDYLADINRYQSTNDTFPTALTIFFLWKIDGLEKEIIALQHSLQKFENSHGSVMLTGRTEMQSALPITIAQLSAAWTGSIERDRWRLHKIRERFRTVALGGTALGTSFPATREYIFAAEKYLRQYTGLNLSRSQNFSDEISSLDKFSELAGAVKTLAGNLFRISNDLMLYTSSFIGEFIHPEAQFGSTIMAAKTNPVFAECAAGCAVDAQFECDKVFRYAELTALQLNPYLPFIAHALRSAFASSGKAVQMLSEKLFPNLSVDIERIESNLYSSAALLNLLLPLLPYEKIKELHKKSKTLHLHNREQYISFIIAETGIDANRIEQLLNPVNATSARRKN